jgi:signal transduction histidine kinase
VLLADIATVRIEADPDQLEQLLINLLRNAAEAALANPDESDRTVRVAVVEEEDLVAVRVEDTGLGIANPANLFVPFFTTKPGGSGIGLTLCRQIAEAHAGRLGLENRSDRGGAVATLTLPRRR